MKAGRAIFLVLAWLRGENRPLPGDDIPGTRLGDSDCLDVVVGGIVELGKGGGDFAERVTRDPFAATLEFTKEEETPLTRNVYNFYRRKLGERYDEKLMAAYSEANQGEWDDVLSRGVVFVDRLKKLVPGN